MATQLETYRHDGLTFDVDDLGGDGEPALLLHGFPQTKGSWHQVAPVLSEAGYRVIAPDQRGYSPGARPPRRRDYSLDRLVEDVVALADAAGIDRFHVIGHDWGGAVAWGLGASHPHRLASLTSLSTPHGRAMGRAMVTSSQALKSWYMFAFQLPFLPEMAVSAGDRLRHSLIDSGLPEEQADVSAELLRGGAARGAINWYRAMPFSPPSLTAHIAVPTMYVYGSDDFALGRRAADLTGRYVTGPYRYEVLDGVGHWIPERGDLVNPLLLEHLAAHPV